MTWAHADKRTWRQIVELLVGVADGLAAAHAAGILHRDIKLENILVAKNGYAKLGDFGLATCSPLVRFSTSCWPDVSLLRARQSWRCCKSSSIRTPCRSATTCRPHCGWSSIRRWRRTRLSDIRQCATWWWICAAWPARPSRHERPASRSSRRWIAMAATALVIIALGVGALWRTRPTSTNAPRIRSLAVLPLQNLSHVDHALQRHDQDGAGDRPRAGRGRDPRRLGATSGRERPHYGATDSRVKAEVARTIAQEIQAHLTPEETRRLASARSIRPDAHEAFLLGRYHYLKSSEAELRQAVDYFERAIRLQPDYAAACAGLSLHGRSSVHSKHSSRIS